MNSIKVQQEILKALLSGKQPVRYSNYGLDEVCVTTDGKVVYIMPEEELLVNLAGAQVSLDLLVGQIQATVRPANRLIGTDNYRMGGKARKYVRAEATEISSYFNTELLKHFTDPELYQDAGSTLSLAVVTERAPGTDERKIVGAVMPIRVAEEGQA